MPYIPHVRIVARFNLGPVGSVKETASCSLSFAKGNPDVTGNAPFRQEMVDDAFADWSAFVTNTASRVTAAVELKECRLYVLDSAGHITQDPAVSTAASVRGGVGASTDAHPWQNSIVTTLVAGVRGAGRFGRIYLPPQSYSMTAEGTVNTTHLESAFDQVKILLAALSDKPLLDAGWHLAIAGKTGTGTLREVVEVRMGRVADTQRRRRRSLDEGYLVSAFSG